MTKLTDLEIKRVQDAKAKGIKFMYARVRKHFSWYVNIFSVESLLKDPALPSYWYRGLADMTERRAEIEGYAFLR